MVYKKRAVSQVATGGVDLSATKQAMHQGLQATRQEGVRQAKELQGAEREIQQTKNTMMTEGLNASGKNMQAAYATFKNDPKGFAKATTDSQKELSSIYKDPEQKAKFLGRSMLDVSVYQAKVNNNFKAQQTTKSNNAYKQNVKEEIDNVYNTAGVSIDALAGNADEDTRQASQMVNKRVAGLLSVKDSKDDKGNYILPYGDRVKIQDLETNLGKYKIMDKLKGLDMNDKASINKMYDSLVNDKDNLPEGFQMDEETYKEVVGKLRSASTKATTPELLAAEMEAESKIKTTFDTFNIEDGEIGNTDLRNIESPLSYINMVKESMNNGLIDIASGEKKIAKMRPHLDKMIQEGKTTESTWTTTNSEYLLDTIESNPAYKQLPKEVQQELIEETYTNAMQGVKLKNKSNADTKQAMNDIVNKKFREATKVVMPFARTIQSSPQMVIGDTSQGMSILPFGGDDTEGLSLNLGGDLEIIDGRTFIVNKNSNGKILSKRRVTSNG